METVFGVIPALLHEGFTVSLDGSSSQVQALLSTTPVVAIVGAGESTFTAYANASVQSPTLRRQRPYLQCLYIYLTA
jgi:hypothetical protein